MMRHVMTWAPVVGTVAAGVMLIGAGPVAPRAFPPLPVTPVERQAAPPYFARVTISGDAEMTGVFETCTDPAATLKSAHARAMARPADAPPPMTGCVHAVEMRPDGAVHIEMSCDRAKGAKASFRMVSEGTPNDLRTHTERYETAAGALKTAIYDSHLVRLGPCPADLKPGQTRRPGGPIVDSGETKRLLKIARSAAP